MKRLNLPRYPVLGATLIGRLARDLGFKGMGIAELLLVDALKVANRMSRKIASVGVVVDAINANAHRFYRQFGFMPFPESERRLFLPMRTVDELFPERESE